MCYQAGWVEVGFVRVVHNHDHSDIEKRCDSKIISSHWRRVAYKCVNKLTIIGLDNGLSPDLRQAII